MLLCLGGGGDATFVLEERQKKPKKEETSPRAQLDATQLKRFKRRFKFIAKRNPSGRGEWKIPSVTVGRFGGRNGSAEEVLSLHDRDSSNRGGKRKQTPFLKFPMSTGVCGGEEGLWGGGKKCSAQKEKK